MTSVDLAGTSPLGGGIHVKPGVELGDTQLAYLRRVRGRLAEDIVVTSGIRTALSQAQTLITKIRLYATEDEALAALHALYRRDDLIDDFWPSRGSVTELAAALEGQIARGNLLSSHLSGRALDLRVRGYTPEALAALEVACVAEGGRVVTEGKPPHMHVEIRGESDRRSPPTLTPGTVRTARGPRVL